MMSEDWRPRAEHAEACYRELAQLFYELVELLQEHQNLGHQMVTNNIDFNKAFLKVIENAYRLCQKDTLPELRMLLAKDIGSMYRPSKRQT